MSSSLRREHSVGVISLFAHDFSTNVVQAFVKVSDLAISEHSVFSRTIITERGIRFGYVALRSAARHFS